MNVLSFNYRPNGSSHDIKYNLLVADANDTNQTISGFVVNKLDKKELKEVYSGKATKEINRKSYRISKVEKIKDLKVL